jgi:hypothetical protein
MTISTYYNGINWVATAQFPTHLHDLINEHYNPGISFDSPAEAIVNLLSNLSKDPTLDQVRMCNVPPELLDYRPLTWYRKETTSWHAEMDVVDWHGRVQALSRAGASPEAALSLLFESAINRGVHISSEQAREAQDLFDV